MDESIPTFLAVTGLEDESVAKQFLEVAGGDLELAVTLYMESGQHGASKSSTTNDNNNSTNTGDSTNPITFANEDEDEALAKRLQEEAYRANDNSNDNVREADTNVHRHETLVDNVGFPGFINQQPSITRPSDIFGNRHQGVFHQRFDFQEHMRMPGFGDDDDDDEIDDEYHDSHDIQVLDSDEDEGEEEGHDNGSTGGGGGITGRRRQLRQNRHQELSSTQRRLANLFRPPFDIISILNLDEAKYQGRQLKKWILINIQDSLEFQCQLLNRDFWSNERIKQIVKENFIFLQYQTDSVNGQSYINFYHVDKFPHIAILDPLTGERVYKWIDGKVPLVNDWIEQTYKFLDSFSLIPGSKNPLVHHEVKIDPTSLSEDQQIQLAMKQSIIDNNVDNNDESNSRSYRSGNTVDDAIELDSDDDDDDDDSGIPDDILSTPSLGTPQEQPGPEIPKDQDQDPFESITPINHPEPTEQPFTRIQIRFPNGKRLVRKLNPDTKIKSIFEWLKYVLQDGFQEYGLNSPDDRFILSNSSNKAFKFIDSLDKTIEEANLKNASILLEQD